jgi:hypothetical protein
MDLPFNQAAICAGYKSCNKLTVIDFHVAYGLGVQAQIVYQPTPGDNPYVVEGVNETIVYALATP